jgi:hypothetical protein
MVGADDADQPATASDDVFEPQTDIQANLHNNACKGVLMVAWAPREPQPKEGGS